MVADELINRYGISADRLNVDSKGSEVQPFTTNDWNRVVIKIAEYESRFYNILVKRRVVFSIEDRPSIFMI